MKKLLATAAMAASVGLILPAFAQIQTDDGINDPDLFGDPEDDGLDVGTAQTSPGSVTSPASPASPAATSPAGGQTTSPASPAGGTTDTDRDGTTTVPGGLPATGGGGMAK